MSLFRKYTRAELSTFVRSVDAHLAEPAQLLVIGGAAAALNYGVTLATKDVDTWSNVPPVVAKAAEAAARATGLEIPVGKAGVADGPYHFEDRLRSVSMRFDRLKILVPERHDLALMKVVRGDRHDEDMVAEMHERRPFDLQTLLTRFEEEMGHVIKDERILRSQFRALLS